jgi:F-type H+-transporting ATPase subunit epsilon
MPFQVDVVSPEAVIWTGEADFLVARTTEGEIGILTDHEPVMAALATGAVIIESGNERTTVGVHGGFLQVLQNQVTLLTDRAEVATGGREGAAELAAELGRIEEEHAEEERAEEERAEEERAEQEQTE